MIPDGESSIEPCLACGEEAEPLLVLPAVVDDVESVEADRAAIGRDQTGDDA